MQLEEGELEDSSNDGLDPYTPLKRPISDVPKHEVTQPVDSDKESDCKYLSSEEDSDDDLLPKGAKMRRTNIPPPKTNKKSKYSVWSRDANEQIRDVLGTFCMRNPENDRNVENYPLPFDCDRKRKDPVRKKNLTNVKMHPVLIEDLEATELSSFEEIAKEIRDKLSEPNYDLVLRIVIICGKEKAIELYNRTKEIENSGGLLIADQSRRRTSGGVFIFLARKDKHIPSAQKLEIFDVSFKKQKIKLARAKQHKLWLKQMNLEKDLESGQEELNNPPPSPEPHCPQPLPELLLRKDLVCGLNLGSQTTDLSDVPNERGTDIHLPDSAKVLPKINSILCDQLPSVDSAAPPKDICATECLEPSDSTLDSPMKRDVVGYDGLYSMDLIYD